MDNESDFSSREEALDFLANYRIYPFISKKGNVFFGSHSSGFLSNKQKEEILRLLQITTDEECKEIRDIVKEKSSKINPHISVKHWVEDERPREMLLKKGSKDMPLSKLLAIILRTGSYGESAEELARKIINRFKTLRQLDEATIEELKEMPGVGNAKVAQIKAALEIGKRLMQESAREMQKLRSPREVALYVSEYFGPYLRDVKKEFFIVVFLDIKNKPIKHVEISKGSINASIVDSKEIVKEATLCSASSVILVHNHPSGETEPSDEDVKVTQQIQKALEFVNVKVLDHIILGKNREDFFSFKNAAIL